MKTKDKILPEKEKKLGPTSFTFRKKREPIRPTFIWWGWKTI